MAEVRPIDANALIESIEAKGKEYGVTVANRCTFRDIVKLAPTLARTPIMPVVRCEDCKHSHQKERPEQGVGLRCDHPNLEYDVECYDQWIDVDPDDFCSCGVLRTETQKLESSVGAKLIYPDSFGVTILYGYFQASTILPLDKLKWRTEQFAGEETSVLSLDELGEQMEALGCAPCFLVLVEEGFCGAAYLYGNYSDGLWHEHGSTRGYA